MSRPGVTLLEMLATLALLSLVVSAGGTWLVTTARGEQRMRETLPERVWLDRAVTLLRRDLDEALPGSIEIDPQRVSISAIVPVVVHTDGVMQHSSGWHRAEWSIDRSSQQLMRRLAPAARTGNGAPRSRAVLDGVTKWEVEQPDVSRHDPSRSDPTRYTVTIEFGGVLRSISWAEASAKP